MLLPSSFIYLIILLGMFLAIVWAVNLWVRYKTWHDEGYAVQQIYNGKRLFYLYLKCWVVALAVFTLLYWESMGIFAITLVFLLAGLALIGIVQGENLAEIRLLQSQSENMMLRSQLNPHFLYNTLNNIDALIWLDQEKASSAVNNLSGLMRYITYSAKQDMVQVDEEISNLQLLIELQRLRMTTPNSLTFETSIDNPKKMIAPLLLLPLIENCFKHCGNINEEGAIHLKIIVKEGNLHFESDNNLSEDNGDSRDTNKPKRKGIGMIILKRRLDLLYGSRCDFEYGIVDDRYKTHLYVRL